MRDEGIGIEAADITLIQDRFGRAQAGRLHAEGAGLGLSIVGSIVAAHAGRLDIDSTPGVGSRFTMVLPLATEQEESDEHDPDN